MILRRVHAIWPAAEGYDVLGLGYGDQVLDEIAPGTRRTIWAAPVGQGAMRWPTSGRSGVTLVDEERLPFPDALFDRILVMHGLEEAGSPDRLLRELWRVAAPEARILLVVSHRRGLWARAENTPFGHGRPYTKAQLNALLLGAMFQPTAWTRALYAPPAPWSFITSAAEAWERAGEIGWRGFGGVLMVEAVKRLYIDPQGRSAEGGPIRQKVAAPMGRPEIARTQREDLVNADDAT